jgi:GNAT superfamily N-acetyltransferase
MNILYKNNISVKDYNSLRKSAGWMEINEEQAQSGLLGSAFLIAAYDNDKAVGVARLVWDNGSSALIKDVLVLPEYQHMGIGTAMMEKILNFLNSKMKPGWMIAIDLMAAVGKEEFYEKFGLSSRPRDNRGSGMDMWIIKE